MEMILDIPDVDTVQDYIAGMLENKKRIMGFGHRVYRTEDPRPGICANTPSAVRGAQPRHSTRSPAGSNRSCWSKRDLSERGLLLGDGAARDEHPAGVLHHVFAASRTAVGSRTSWSSTPTTGSSARPQSTSARWGSIRAD